MLLSVDSKEEITFRKEYHLNQSQISGTCNLAGWCALALVYSFDLSLKTFKHGFYKCALNI